MQHEQLFVENEAPGEISGQTFQMAILNSKLPCGFRFEPSDKVEKPHKAGKRKKPVFS